jgi:hypothetical protein
MTHCTLFCIHLNSGAVVVVRRYTAVHVIGREHIYQLNYWKRTKEGEWVAFRLCRITKNPSSKPNVESGSLDGDKGKNKNHTHCIIQWNLKSL